MSSSTSDSPTRFIVGRGPDREAGWPGRRAGPMASSTALERRRWAGRLARALREDLFVVHYQPILSLRTGTVSHYEALVRLADESDGSLLPPAAFLPAAERYGLIQAIDRLVLRRVLAMMAGELRHEPGAARLSLSRPRAGASWPAGLRRPADIDLSFAGGSAQVHAERLNSAGGRSPGPADSGMGAIRVAVNLSALSITDSSMLGHIELELARNDVAPGRVVVEITETSAIGDMRRARAFCAGLEALGCSVALDDFGVGFGSFHYVKHLSFHYLKIDGDFIRALPDSPRDQLLVRALVGVARGLGKQTIAEYVGDQATITLLRELGVDYAQGFGVGRPRAAEDTFAAQTAFL